MDLRQPETWRRHQLASTERMQADIGRSTRPVMGVTCSFSLVYLLTWGPLCMFWDIGNLPWLPALTAALSGLVAATTFPAFALAVGIESYFSRRLRLLEASAT